MAIKFEDIIASNVSDGILTTGDQIKITKADTKTKLQVGSDIVSQLSLQSDIFKDLNQTIDRTNFKSISFLSDYPNAVDTAINEVIRVTTTALDTLASKINTSTSTTPTTSDGLDNIKTNSYFLLGTDLDITTIGAAIKNLSSGYGYVQNDLKLATNADAAGLNYAANTSTKPFSGISSIPKNTLIKCISTDVSDITNMTSYDLSKNITIIAMPGGSTDSDLTDRVAALEALLKLGTD